MMIVRDQERFAGPLRAGRFICMMTLIDEIGNSEQITPNNALKLEVFFFFNRVARSINPNFHLLLL